MTVQRLHLTVADREQSRERYVSFEVPAGARGLEIRLDYSSSDATIDLGLFAPNGFRGYSGSARRRVAVTPERATPGYLAGELAPGAWNVYLGLHRITGRGADVVVGIDVGAAEVEPSTEMPPAPEPLPARRVPAAGRRRWLRGDLHAHTHHSDGRLSVAELAASARANGLDFLAVTDHNTVSHHAELEEASRRYDVELIPGEEVTAPRGHANCLGSTRWVDWRTEPEDWVARAHEGGGLLSINHPTGPDQTWPDPVPEGTDLIEAWHGRWDRMGDGALSWWRSRDHVGVGGSDFHGGPHRALARPTTWVEAEDDDVLGALRTGRVAISASPDAPLLVRLGDEVRVLDAEGLTLEGPDGADRVRGSDVSVRAGAGHYCLRDESGRLMALTA
ncbi:MAG: CehA/McbA family metallohydrolase [Actinomycetota bacterium]